MATSLASQFQTIRSVSLINSDSQKHPITSPSILFSPKEAADIGTETIFSIAQSGLDVLIESDSRFRNFKNDLFNHKTMDMDRELLPEGENKRIDSSISSFLKLLSCHLESPGSLKSLEYLLRRYKIHVYNMEELIFCALPYHDTHIFVQIVQLLDFRNDKWRFLEGIKLSGAPLPRHLLVQQCIRDTALLDALCNYASPSKKYQPSQKFVSLCTAVVVETLGCLTTVESDVVKILFPFVSFGLKPSGMAYSDLKASALMIIGMLSFKVSLSPKLLKSIVRSVTEILCDDAKDNTNGHWIRLSMMALINIVQLQHLDLLPKKAMDSLMETRDIIGLLLQLSREYNIEKFLNVFFYSLAEYSSSDERMPTFLISAIKSIPIHWLVRKFILKILSRCWKASHKNDVCNSSTGIYFKNILMAINDKYPSEFSQSVQIFIEENMLQSADDESQFVNLCNFLDGNHDSTVLSSCAKTWLALHHPKVEIRSAALNGLNSFQINKADNSSSQMLSNIKGLLLGQLQDSDLSVIKAALSVEGLLDVVDTTDFVSASNVIVERCISVVISGQSEKAALAYDVTVSYFKIAQSIVDSNVDVKEKLALAMFPALLILPKTQRLNIKMLKLAKDINWPWYENLVVFPSEEKKLQQEVMTELNMKNVDALSESLLVHYDRYMYWLMKTPSLGNTAKCLFLFVLLQSFTKAKNERRKFEALFDSCISDLKKEWGDFESSTALCLEIDKKILQWDESNFLEQLHNADIVTLNRTVLICIFWKIAEGLVKFLPSNVQPVEDNKNDSIKLWELFSFFASSDLKQSFKEHLHFIAKHYNNCRSDFLSSKFTRGDLSSVILVECLNCFASICSDADDAHQLQLLPSFPSLLVPLLSENQDVKIAAMRCVEALFVTYRHVQYLSRKNGNNASWFNFLEDLLMIIIEQKRQIVSDSSFLSSFFPALLGSSCTDLRVASNIVNRFDQASKDKIIGYILSYTFHLGDFAKLAILSLLKGLGSKLLIVKDVELFLCQLLEKRNHYNENSMELSEIEISILCMLLEICSAPSQTSDGPTYEDYLLKAMQLDGLHLGNHSVTAPCIASLQNLNRQFFSRLTISKQELFFLQLVALGGCSRAEVQNAARKSFIHLDLSHSVVIRTLEHICQMEKYAYSSDTRKKTKFALNYATDVNCASKKDSEISLVNSLLDMLMLKKDMTGREFLIGPLFHLLKIFFANGFFDSRDENRVESSSMLLGSLFLVLEDIIKSAVSLPHEIKSELDVQLLLGYARSEKDGNNLNQIISLLTTIAKVTPDIILENLVDIFAIMGTSTMQQGDIYSHRVFEEFVSVVVPSWLAENGDIEKLLEIIVQVLSGITDCRRLSIMIFVLRNMGEQKCLPSLLALLFQSISARFGHDDKLSSSSEVDFGLNEWEYKFALRICEHYPCSTWLPSLVNLVQPTESAELGKEMLMGLICGLEFISVKLNDPELVLKLELSDNSEEINKIFRKLMVQVVSIFSILRSKRKEKTILDTVRRRAKECSMFVLKTITMRISPSAFFRGIFSLLVSSDHLVKRTVFEFISEAIKNPSSAIYKYKGNLNMDAKTLKYYGKMCSEIIHVANNRIDETDYSLRASAIGTIESLVRTFPYYDDIYILCLPSVAKSMESSNLKIASAAFRATGGLVNALGPKCLMEFPKIMESILRKISHISGLSKPHIAANNDIASSSHTTLLLSLLATVEAVVDKLGGFISPFLCNIIEMLVLWPEYTSEAHSHIKQKADDVRKLLTEKIPIRLAFPSLTKIYFNAVSCGASSVTISFNMLDSFVARMDRSAVGTYYEKVFEYCLQALDLRREQRDSIEEVAIVEKSVVNAVISLTMKLTETMFKPLFIKAIEWSEDDLAENKTDISGYLNRNITFFNLVNGLLDNHRSLFVPYFKYLVESCTRHLTYPGDSECYSRKKKKAKTEGTQDAKGSYLLLSWHLRALVTLALHKCFLYDTGAVKFLDSSNFQQLLKPLVAQLSTEPPDSLEECRHIPAVNEVDDIVVLCIGQMAVTAGTDLLWKPLNHEVLLQSRSEKVRTRVLSVRVVKYLLDHLREEYLVLLPETMPFLAELLEDAEPPVKSLTQDILKQMESLSNESLQQYLL